MTKYFTIVLVALTFNLSSAQINPSKSSNDILDSLLLQVQLMSSENPQEANRLAYVSYKTINEQSSTTEKIKYYLIQTEANISMGLLQNAEAHIDTAISIASKGKNIKLLVDSYILQSKLYFKEGDYSKSSKALVEANKIAAKKGFESLQVKLKLVKGDYSKQQGNYNESIKTKKAALEQAKKQKNKSDQADCYNSIGSTYWQFGHYNEALENYYKSLIFREDANDSTGIISSLKNIGLTYRELGQFEKAVATLTRALEISEKRNNNYDKSEVLNLIGSLYFKFNLYDEAIKYYKQSLDLRIALGLIRSSITSYGNMARAYAKKTMYNEALDQLNAALSLQEKLVDPLAEAATLTEMGNLNLQKGNIAESLRRYLMALKLRQTYGQDEDVAKSLTNIGLVYRKLGLYKGALKYMEQANEIVQRKELNANDAAYILQNLGHIYVDQKNYGKALAAYKQALTYKEKSGDNAGTARILQNIAQAQLQMGLPSKARTSLTQALKLSVRLKDNKGTADIYNELGNAERQANNLDIAINNYKTAADRYQLLSDFDGKALCLRKIGEIQITQKKFNDAEQNINQSIRIGNQTGNAYLLSYGYLAKHNLYVAKGNYKQALTLYEKHIAIRDSLENIKRNETNLEAQLDLELDQKKTEIKIMEAEVEALKQKTLVDKVTMEKQKVFRNFLIAIVLFFVSLAGASILNLVQKRKHTKILEEKISEIRLINDKLTQSENDLKQTIQTKDKLFSIIAHDLRSPFTALVGLSEILATKVSDLTSEEISEFSMHINQSATGVLALTENLLSWSRSQTGKLILKPCKINLKELVDKVIAVANIPAKEKNISIQSSINPNIEIFADAETILTVIRNLVSNAIKFTPQGGNIKIKAISIDNNVEIEVSDTGVGIDPDNIGKLFRVDGLTTKGTNQENGTGLGLMLCKEFVEKNNGTIDVESTLGLGTTFKIVLPQKSTNNDKETA